jgi:hypothetical protein
VNLSDWRGTRAACQRANEYGSSTPFNDLFHQQLHINNNN